MYIVQLHTPDGTVWLGRFDTMEEAEDMARDKSDNADMKAEDDFISIVKAEKIFTKA